MKQRESDSNNSSKLASIFTFHSLIYRILISHINKRGSVSITLKCNFYYHECMAMSTDQEIIAAEKIFYYTPRFPKEGGHEATWGSTGVSGSRRSKKETWEKPFLQFPCTGMCEAQKVDLGFVV